MSTPSGSGAPLAALFGLAGTVLTKTERDFFRDIDPAGFILFRRNIAAPAQIAALVSDLRECVGRADAPVLIDQEGGRVARLPSPPWRKAPPAAIFGEIAASDPDLAARASYLNSLLIGSELRGLGINVDCAPLLDLRVPGAHDIIGDRAFGADPAVISLLGRASCDGFLASGVVPVIKHIPGHGRARVDSHVSLPVVETSLEVLRETDFVPFAALSDMPMAMTAHIVYTALDDGRPATTSSSLIGTIIRGELGFDGLLMSDDLCMKALSGSLAERTGAVIAAGCDVVLHCNGDLAEMEDVARHCPALSESGMRRLRNALARVGATQPHDVKKLTSEFAEICAKITG